MQLEYYIIWKSHSTEVSSLEVKIRTKVIHFANFGVKKNQNCLPLLFKSMIEAATLITWE